MKFFKTMLSNILKFKNIFDQKFKNLDSVFSRTGFIVPQNIKESLGLSTGQATFLLETSVRSGELKFKYLLRCPTCDRILKSYNYKYEIPEDYQCEVSDDHQPFIKSKHDRFIQKVYLPHGREI